MVEVALVANLRAELAAVARAEERIGTGSSADRPTAVSPSRTSGSKRNRWPSARSRSSGTTKAPA